jgi:hypothetical protein
VRRFQCGGNPTHLDKAVEIGRALASTMTDPAFRPAVLNNLGDALLIRNAT